MSTVEKIDVNKVKVTFSVDAARFEEGMQYSYNKNKNNIDIQGFRKGKAPRKIIEMQFGKQIFFEDAINFVLPDALDAAIKENELEIVSRPEIDVLKLDDEGVDFSAEFFVKPEVEVGEYKGISYEKPSDEVTEDEIMAEINKEREKNARIVKVADRPIQNGDLALIDFKGYMDGVAFAGGEGKDFDLEIGSHTFIDTFEEQLIGHVVGDDVEVNVTFPEEYHQKDYAGKPAKFEVEIKDINYKELPELNDEFVSNVTEFETLDEYKNDIKGKLEVAKKEQADNQIREIIMTKLIDEAKMDVPAPMVDNEIMRKIDEFRHNLESQGISLDMYLQYMGQTMESLQDAYRPVSEKQVKGRLVLEAIAAKEGFEISDAEVEEEVERISQQYQIEKEKLAATLRPEDRINLMNDLKVQKAIDFVVENAVAQ